MIPGTGLGPSLPRPKPGLGPSPNLSAFHEKPK